MTQSVSRERSRFSATGAVLAMVILFGAPAVAAPKVVDYSISTRGDVGVDVADFEQVVSAAYADPRGWSLGGIVQFRQVKSGGDLVLWLASPDAMTSFSHLCSPEWSCRVGRDVVVNDLRFRDGSPYWSGPLESYRILLVNHETGHWIGFDHSTCAAAGDDAPVMMQQSKGVGECVGNPWPLDAERRRAADLLGLGSEALAASDPPHARGFTPVP